MTTWAYDRKFLILRLKFDGAHTNLVVAYFDNIIECEKINCK